jgi:hypothetical protein
MTLYSIALFIHIVGALLLFALLAVEGVSFRQGLTAARLNRIAGPISALFILVPGLYLAWTGWGWKSWIAVGLTGWVLIAITGAVTGVLTLRRGLDPRVAVLSLGGRVGMALGIVFAMTVKPDAAVSMVAAVGGALGGALLAAGAQRLRRERPASA